MSQKNFKNCHQLKISGFAKFNRHLKMTTHPESVPDDKNLAIGLTDCAPFQRNNVRVLKDGNST